MKKLISRIFWALQPVIEFIDHAFTVPFTIKKIHGGHYYLWRDRIFKGVVFVTDIYGIGSNIINPSNGKHAAIYFGFGLRTFLDGEIKRLKVQRDSMKSSEMKSALTKQIDRLENVIHKKEQEHLPIRDDIPYVIEALGKGVTVTNLVKFLTTKDVVRAYRPSFADKEKMSAVSNSAVLDLGLKYDFGFSDEDDAKYCFEVVIDAYLNIFPNMVFERTIYKLPIFGVVFDVYLAPAFTEDHEKWNCIINSKTEFPELYK